jgi:hypothetical protein
MKRVLIAMSFALLAGGLFAASPTACGHCEVIYYRCEANATSAGQIANCERAFNTCMRSNGCPWF